MLIPPRHPRRPYIVAIPYNERVSHDARTPFPIPLRTHPCRPHVVAVSHFGTPYTGSSLYTAANPRERTRNPPCPHAVADPATRTSLPIPIRVPPPIPDNERVTNDARTHAVANSDTACTYLSPAPPQLSRLCCNQKSIIYISKNNNKCDNKNDTNRLYLTCGSDSCPRKSNNNHSSQ